MTNISGFYWGSPKLMDPTPQPTANRSLLTVAGPNIICPMLMHDVGQGAL